ncbi:M23 family metallopeptidase [Clostridium sp.]|uniref:murein hydrolase activator EnvC family protein n=1 Tax=Clostridium sp. TaxID=1506 RepID=UPI00261BE344|nr:M23 family metallopeptidase [Clostridium sp.]
MNRKRIAAVILSATMILGISLPSNVVQAKTKEEAQQEINNNKDKINGLNDKKDAINSQKTESEKKLDEIQNQIAEKNKLLLSSQKKVDEYKNNINALQESITKLEGKISGIQSSIENKKQEQAEKEKILASRIRSAYKNNLGNEFLYILIESKGVGELLNNIANISFVIETDNKLINDIKQVEKDLKSQESDLESQKKTLSEEKSRLETEKKEYDSLVKQYEEQITELNNLETQKQNEINSLSDQEKNLLNEINAYKEDNSDLTNYINQLTAKEEAAKKEQEKQNNNSGNNSGSSGNETSKGTSEGDSSGGKVSASGFIRPAPGGVTDPFGPRIHPVTGKHSVHTGADLGASYGTPIHASKAGTVIEAGWNTAYGNMVIIDHGDGTKTLYGHSCRLAVTTGQHVSQGQVIAYVGSTGYSTGPHLHFGIMINGQWVNPMNYIS